MKIGFFSSRFPYNQTFKEYSFGGSVISTFNLIQNLLMRAHEFKVFTSSRNFWDSYEKHKNIEIFRYGSFKFSSTNIALGLFHKPFAHKFDIAHVSFDIPPSPWSALRYVNKNKVPLVLTYHGDLIEGYGGVLRRIGVRGFNKCITKKLLSQADVIISPSKNNIQESKFLCDFTEKIHILPNGININDFHTVHSKVYCRNKLGIPHERKIILFVGYLSPHKGPEILLNSMPLILKEISDAELIFVGDGVLKNYLEKKTKKLGINNNVRFVGGVWDDSVKSIYYKSADLLAVPSLSESFGIVNLEAMASGIPIIASNVGGIPDLVTNGKNGFLVPPNDINMMADTIIYLLNNDHERKKLGNAGTEIVKDYSWEKIAEETEKIYIDLFNR